MVTARLLVRIDFDEGTILSPGKVRLFELVDACGSIKEAAATINMSYAHARQIIERMEGLFGAPLVVTKTGGSKGARSKLTELGREVVGRYRATERTSARAAETLLNELVSLTVGRQSREVGSR
jgi:molybdate transport system regulatory protein